MLAERLTAEELVQIIRLDRDQCGRHPLELTDHHPPAVEPQIHSCNPEPQSDCNDWRCDEFNLFNYTYKYD